MTRGRNGLFSLARARYNRLLASAIQAAICEASLWCPPALLSLILSFIRKGIDSDTFAVSALGVTRGPRDLAADIFFVRPGTIGAHVSHSWLWRERAKETDLYVLDGIDEFARVICSGIPEDCEIGPRPYPTPSASRIEAVAIAFTEHLNAKFSAYEKAPMIVP